MCFKHFASGRAYCDNGVLVTWDEAEKRCRNSGGNLLLQQDNLDNLCPGKEDGVWVGLRKTAHSRKPDSNISIFLLIVFNIK